MTSGQPSESSTEREVFSFWLFAGIVVSLAAFPLRGMYGFEVGLLAFVPAAALLAIANRARRSNNGK